MAEEMPKAIKNKTINNDEFIKSIFDGFNIQEHNVQYSLSKKSSGRRHYGELIITN
jgi:hypothetical protein